MDQLARLRGRIGGRVFTRDDPDPSFRERYFNHRVAGDPSLIVHPANQQDIAAAVRFAADAGLAVGVVGGGHNPSVSSAVANGLLIDMAGLTAVEISPDRRRVRIAGGARWKAVDAVTTPLGLATPGGDCCTVGVAGFVLGGGHGVLTRAHGLGCDNLVAARLVTASGDILDVDAETEADLFWGLRGGGNGNFGIVTQLEQRLIPLPESLRGGALIWPFDHARDAIKALRDIFANDPTDELTLTINLARMPYPDGPPMAVLYGVHLGGADAEKRDLAPLRRVGPPAMDIFGDMPYAAIQTLSEEDLTGPARVLRGRWKGGFVGEPLGDDAIDRFVQSFEAAPTPFCRAHLDLFGGGAVSRIAPAETAYRHRGAACNVEFLGLWREPHEDDTVTDWVRGAHKAMSPYLDGGVYPGYGDRDLPDWGHRYFGGNLDRLLDLKRRADPESLFRFPQGLSELV